MSSRAQRTKRPSQVPTRRALLWVLDDSVQQASLIRDVLEPLANVRLFHDGPEMLEALATQPPDALVLDWHLPDVAGLEVLRMVRESFDEVTLPVLMLTGLQRHEEDMVAALEAGANDYATKPFVKAELQARVGTLLRVQGLHARARHAESEYQASEARLRVLTDANPLLISFVTAEETYGFANRAYEEWFGIPSEQLVGRKVREVIGEAAYAVLGPMVRRGLAGERFSFEQHGVPYRAGGKRDVRVTFVPVSLELGEPAGYLAILEDITTQRALASERENLARERTEHLERQSQFEQQLIGIVSHDLRTPLNVMMLSSARLARDESLSVGALKNVVRVQNAADRAARMVADLLDFTQARLGGGIRIERRSADVRASMETLVAELEAAYPDRTIVYTHKGSPDGQWDPERISQLMQNLITNALKYSPATSLVEVTTTTDAEVLNLSVHNEGEAIAEDKLPLLFHPLQRGTEQVDRTSRSVGLGLYIVQKIAEAHGGTVQVRSTDASGTTFSVVIPRGLKGSPPA